ncbi:MAG: hypothetical protein MRZ79_01835 [Bacteroidia bacterium]|nr:hypothetical protein [Bacteroidia bacterium]
MQSYTWFFSLKDELDAEQFAKLKGDFDQFTSQWKTHGAPVDGLIQIRHKRFVIAQSNPADDRPSGCSIDSLRRGVEAILRQHQLKTFDNGYVFFVDADGEIQEVHFKELPQYIDGGRLDANTLVLDHSLSHSDDLEKWEVPLQSTWLKRYLK